MTKPKGDGGKRSPGRGVRKAKSKSGQKNASKRKAGRKPGGQVVRIPTSAVPFWSAPPSKETLLPWIEAERLMGRYPAANEGCGKWLIFARRDVIDELWEKIGRTTMKGELGGAAKVSTAWDNPNAVSKDIHVICVYTYDVNDLIDVRRVREVLRQLGVEAKIPYKTDRATHQGKYRVRGDKGISTLFE